MLSELPEKDKYRALYSSVRGDVLSGKLAAGTKLPSKRALASALGVSVVTVQTAYEQLLAEGYIVSRERSGYYVCEVAQVYVPERTVKYEPEPARQKYALDFVRGSAPAEIFPFSVWAKLTRKVLSDCAEHLLERVPCDGDFELKRAISDYLYRARAIDADPRRIVIGAGAEYLYGIIAELADRSLIAVENPGYNVISQSYKRGGATCVYIPVTGAGIDCAAVEKSGARAVHVSPSHQFPTGAVMPVSERARLIAYAKANDAYIIEDDYDSEFRLSGKPLESAYSLCPDRVIYMNTFSKSLAPSMRMGYMVLPEKLYRKYVGIFSETACVVPLFEQKTLALMLDGGYFERHLARLKNYYRGVRASLFSKLAEEKNCEVCDTGSGLHIIVRCHGMSDDRIRAAAELKGANVRCLSDYLLAPADGFSGAAVLNYSSYKPNV